ncbi:MAG: ergothioneine biosynthesis protein EgtC [Cyanophyceae cyanobacterium]
MCRLLSYLGPSIPLDKLLYKPEHSLIVQSYQPREMSSGVANADGFGVGWYHADQETPPYTYRNLLPIWSDLNLPQLSRYVESHCVLSYVRSATAGQAVDLSNCQPFTDKNLLFIHNGAISNFRKTMYRPIRDSLSDETYQLINGTTDSEHILALLLDHLNTSDSLAQAVANTLGQLRRLAQQAQVSLSANLVISDGKQLVASRYAYQTPSPTLYWLRDDPLYPDAVMVASEPLFDGNWNSFPEHALVSVGEDLELHLNPVDEG